MICEIVTNGKLGVSYSTDITKINSRYWWRIHARWTTYKKKEKKRKTRNHI